MKKRKWVSFAYIGFSLAGILLFSSFAFSQLKLSLSPLLHQLEMHPGQRKSIVTWIGYTGEKPVTIRCFVTDFVQTRNGNYKVLDEPQPDWKFSAASWVRIKEENQQFTLKSGEEKTVICEVDVPRDLSLSGGRYAALVFELLPEKIEGKPFIGLTYRYRMASFIEIIIKGGIRRPKEKVSLTDLTIVSTATQPRYKKYKDAHIFTASVTNKGDIHVEAKGKLLIRNEQGRIIKQIPLGGGRGVVLPETTANFTSVVKDPRPGKYIAEALLEYAEGRRPAIIRKGFVIGKEYADKDMPEGEIPALTLNTESLVTEIPAGGFRSMLVVAENNENAPVAVQVGVEKISPKSNGKEKVSILDGLSCTDWLKVSPERFIIAPNRSQVIRVGIKVPRNVKGEKYADLVFQTTKKDQSKSSSQFEIRVPAMIGITGTLTESLEVLTTDISSKEPADIKVEIKNTGNTHLEVKGKLSILDTEGKSLGEGELAGGKILIFPQQTTRISFLTKEPLSPGEYLVEVNLTFGKNDGKVSKKIPLKVK